MIKESSSKMILRAGAFLACVLAVAFGGFNLSLDQEVKRVTTVHVLDKTNHLIHMFEAIPQMPRDFTDRRFEGDRYDELADMAGALHVKSIGLFDRNGTQIGSLNMNGAGAVHAGHSHGGTLQDGHLEQEAAAHVPAPRPADFQPLLDGTQAQIISFSKTQSSDLTPAEFATVLSPLQSPAGDRLGYMGVVLSIGKISSVYAKGATTLGLLFMVCGAILFAVPALAFWLQKRLAERSSQDANYLSRHDTLTGLLNRSAFMIEGQKRLEQERIGYAVHIDVDRFKVINDNYGQRTGDAVLRHIAGHLTSKCGVDALVARLGADEFGLTLPHCDPKLAQDILDDMMQGISQQATIDGVGLSTTVSMGVAQPEHNKTLDALMHRAEIALSFAKSDGRNQAAHFTREMGAASRRRRQLEACLHDACRHGQFEIHYQPLVDAQTLAVVGYEALLRLNDQDGDPISPVEFIPIAEEIGLIEQMGAWVLQQATQQISALDNHSGVSINLSAEQFRSGEMVDLVSRALEQSGLSPDRLELEITESILLESDGGTAQQIETLKEMGISIAMDDFGTGFSSLSTLWNHGFDRIKIDKSFVQCLDETPEKSEQLIDAIVLLGGRMGMSITAEGIETEHQREVLSALGCNVLQGYLFGKPQPIALPDARNAGATVA